MPPDLPDRTKEVLTLFNESKLLILHALYRCPDHLCGCDLAEHLAMPKNLLSYHLSMLREGGFVEEAKCGRKKQYRLSPASRDKVHAILTITELM
jgi:DNA-binding transcriptional ArsR family regulator